MFFLGLIVQYLPTIMQVLGLTEKAQVLIKEYEDKKKRQAEANIPITQKEISDAADKGNL